MSISSDQVMAALILATIALVPIGGILYRLLRFWGGARGRSPSERSRTPDSVVSWPPIYDAQVTAANVAAIRSDLDAVSRQMQDLEKRLRSTAAAPSSQGRDRGMSQSHLMRSR